MKASRIKPVIAIYLRSSTGKQVASIETQKAKTKAFCQYNEFSYGEYRYYTDQAVSGSKASRKALDKMLKDIEKGEVKTVLVYSLSRLGRNVAQLAGLADKLRTKKVALVSVTENIDTSTPSGSMMFNMMASFSQYERELISERTIAGLDNARAKGKKWGWKKTRPSEEIRELRKQGFGYRKIAELCNCSIGSVRAEIKAMNDNRPITVWGKKANKNQLNMSL